MKKPLKNPIFLHLDKLKFIGPFPRGWDVLLVPVDAAHREALVVDKKISLNDFKKLLKEFNILFFSTIDDWVKFRDGKKGK